MGIYRSIESLIPPRSTEKILLRLIIAIAKATSITMSGIEVLGGIDETCFECHADRSLSKTNSNGTVVSLFVDEPRLRASVHGTKTCVACHADITDAHPDDNVPARPVQCGNCHTDAAASYSTSVHHVRGTDESRPRATCADCLGYHAVLPVTLPESDLHFRRLGQTCGKCHKTAAAEVDASVHGRALAQGHREAPVCTDCHLGHAVTVPADTSASPMAQEACSKCHASERINTRFGLPSDRVRTFFDSYHGLALRFGDVRAAHCGSCHGHHLVLPQTDSRSSIHPDKLASTCGKCHPGATSNFARGRVHLDLVGPLKSTDTGTVVNRFVRKFYQILIIACIGLMAWHNALLLLSKALARRRSIPRPVLRMNMTQRCQHFVLVVSFVTLAVSGFALRWPDSWISWLLFDNELVRRWVHRSSGVLLLAGVVWHLFYVLFTIEGRQLFLDFLPRARDFADAIAALNPANNRRKRAMGPARFSYVEKIEYWAVVWGVLIMGLTGLALWFKVEVTHWVPRWIVDVAGTIHYYEAILASLAVVVWHFYHVIFDPDVYPMNWAWLDGYAKEPADTNARAAEKGSSRS